MTTAHAQNVTTPSLMLEVGSGDFLNNPIYYINNNEVWAYQILLVIGLSVASLVAARVFMWFIRNRVLPKFKWTELSIYKTINTLSYLALFIFVIFLLKIIHINIWQYLEYAWSSTLFTIGKQQVKLNQLVLTTVFAIGAFTVVLRYTPVLRDKVLPKFGLNAAAAASVSKIFFYLANLFIVIFSFVFLNIDVTVFAFLGGAVAIAVGFGAQNILNNFISGLILLIERPVKIGDLVEFNNMYGTIEEITARCTRIRTPRNIYLLIPNSVLLENTVTNWSFSDPKVRTHVTVGVAYGSPVKKVIELLKKAAIEHEKIYEKPEPFVLFEDFGDNALIFEVHFWMDVWVPLEMRQVQSDMRVRVDGLFREADITIAFPQRDVHVDSLTPLQVRMVEKETEEEAKKRKLKEQTKKEYEESERRRERGEEEKNEELEEERRRQMEQKKKWEEEREEEEKERERAEEEIERRKKEEGKEAEEKEDDEDDKESKSNKSD